MTRAVRLLRELAARNVAITVEGGRLRFSPRSALDPDLIASIVACGSEIRVLLQPAPAGVPHAAALQIWLLHAIAQAPQPLPSASLYRHLDRTIALLVRRGELQAGADGTLALRTS